MSRLKLLPLILLVLVTAAHALAPTARPEKVDLSPAQLRELATHVVVGEVRAVYTRKEKEGSWEVTRHVAEVAPATVEKGEGIDTDGLLYVRYWTRRFLGRTPPPSTSGHRGLPAAGETLRLYLARNAYDGFSSAEHNADGGYNVIGANGFERLKARTGTPEER